MIKKECFTAEWIEQVSSELHYNDKNLIEKVIRALSLLEMLVKAGCPLVFKGLYTAIHKPLKIKESRQSVWNNAFSVTVTHQSFSIAT